MATGSDLAGPHGLNNDPQVRQLGMKPRLWDAICVAVLCVILSLGLWPFHTPKNDVTWLGNRNGLRFGRLSTVFGAGALQTAGAGNEASGSVEIWLHPSRIWDRCTFLAFYAPENSQQFSLRQSDAGLDLKTGTRNDPHRAGTASFHVKDVFRGRQRVFLAVTAGTGGAVVYINGVRAATAPQLRLSTKDFTGRLILGDSPGQTDSWSGQLLGLAVYFRELAASQVLHHYETWSRNGRPEVAGDERNVALYLFNERSGNVVHDQAGPGLDLKIPEKYVVLDQIFLEPFWKEFEWSRSYWSAALKNVVGFVPFGFCFYACLLTRKLKRAAIVTVLLGALVSLTIEVLQVYIPSRDSGTTDLFTNTLGTWLGVVSYRVASPVLTARFPWLHFVAWPRG
jgi:VanZ like protein/concanavalin A-like lectin/glucanase superfamily protein